MYKICTRILRLSGSIKKTNCPIPFLKTLGVTPLTERTPGHTPAPSLFFKRWLGATHPHGTHSKAHSHTESFREEEKSSAGSHNPARRLQPWRCVGLRERALLTPDCCPCYHPKCPPPPKKEKESRRLALIGLIPALLRLGRFLFRQSGALSGRASGTSLLA